MNVIAFTIAVVLSLAALGEAGAQAFPSKPVRLIVGSSVGSGPDATIRGIAGPLGEMWKQQVVVENRPSPGGIAAAEIVAKATPDGHTLLMCSVGTHGIAPVLNKKLPYDHVKDFTPISRIGAVANGLIVNPSLPAKSVKEFVAHAKANPGKIQYGSSGVGNSPHLSMELFRSMAGINLVHVPVPPGQSAPQEVAGGRVMAAFSNMPNVIPLARSGKARALAVTSAKRNAQLPDVPTMIESGFAGFEVTVWSGVCGPARLPKAVVAKINADLGKVLGLPDTQKRFAEQGAEVTSSTPDQFAAFIKAENARWAKAAKSAGVEPK
jgi:tripartite-type tricarboxylate transporter receptor subunit TctC